MGSGRNPGSDCGSQGVLFILAATGGILLLTGNPHGSEHLKELLVGQILWQTWSSLVPIAVLYVVILAIWFGFRPQLGGLKFYLAFAVVVTASVQIVGIYLVFASLIVPALATYGIKKWLYHRWRVIHGRHHVVCGVRSANRRRHRVDDGGYSIAWRPGYF
jgi:ABC-type Mn2+/Zn2+ transport system permease subunit